LIEETPDPNILRVETAAQPMDMSPFMIGQQVTVVIVLIWFPPHALQYPLGQIIPGEKKAVRTEEKPDGMQSVGLSW